MQNEKMIERWQLPYVENDNSDFLSEACNKQKSACVKNVYPERGILLFHRLYLFWWSELLWLALFYPSHWSTHSMAAGNTRKEI